MMPIIYTTKELPTRSDKDLYITPQPVIDAALSRFGQRGAQVILDCGANDGRWGIAAAAYADNPICLVGVDIRPLPQPEGFTFWHTLDYSRPIECALMAVKRFDLIIGNPPFNVAESIIRNAWQQLKQGGSMLFLLPSHFWYSAGRYRGLWRDMPPLERCSIVNRIPFTGNGNPNLYDLYFWCKGEGIPNECRNTQMLF